MTDEQDDIKPVRKVMPARRPSETFQMSVINANWQEFKYTVMVSWYDYGGPIGEVFMNAEKINTDIDVAARDTAILLSFCLQHGVDVRPIQHSLTRDVDGRPLGLLGTLLDTIFPEAKESDPTS